ncbi:alpha/beta hydrolase fold domain-containing protein [Gordonia terrae]|uniref:alpha/beta hydrolase n=1 Tax=Gordonia terrae TaxID=2055 RepID=UPI003F6BD892
MPLDPQTEGLLDALAAQGVPPFDQMTVAQARETAHAFIDLQGDAEEVAEVRTETVPVDGGTIDVRIYRPDAEGPLPLVVYFHGGGWVIGDLAVADKPCRALANAARAVVASVDYRLAPEYPFPTPFDDCYAATVWLAQNAADFGADAGDLTVSGDSAGGNLATTVSLAARDRNGPKIARQVLLYPVTSPAEGSPFASYVENAEGYLLTAGSMRWFWNHYLPSPGDVHNPYAVPLAAADLSGLPPAFIAVCEYDPLRDEGIAYAEKLRGAGVPVTLHRIDGAVHGLYWMGGAVELGRSLLDEVAAVVRATAPESL